LRTGLLKALLLALLATTMAVVSRAPGAVARDVVVLRGVLEAAILALLLYLLVIRELATSRTGSIVRGRAALTLALPLTVFAILAFLTGLLRHNPPTYLYGDLYRYLKVPAVFWLSCWVLGNATRKRREVETFLYLVAVVVTLAFAADVAIQVARYGIENRLWTTALQFLPWVVVIVIFLLEAGWRGAKMGVFLAFMPVYVFGLWLSQSRAVIALMVLALGFLLFARVRARTKVATLAGATASLFFVSAIAFNGDVLYGVRRFSLPAARDPTNYNYYDLGSRIYELKSVADYLTRDPVSAAVGTGMGSTITTLIADMDGVRFDATHYIHNSYAEVAYRTGVVGLALVVVFFARIRRSLRRAPRPELARALTRALVLLVPFLVVYNFLFENTVLYLLLGALFVLAQEARTTLAASGFPPPLPARARS